MDVVGSITGFFQKHSLGNYLSAPMGDGYDMAGSHEDCYTGLL